MVLFACTAAYLLSYLAASRGMYILSGLVLIGTAAGTAFYDYRKSGRLICPAVLFSLSWIGGSGISCLKLSRLQVPWETETWLCIYLTYAVFRIVYMWSAKLFENKRNRNNSGGISAAGAVSEISGFELNASEKSYELHTAKASNRPVSDRVNIMPESNHRSTSAILAIMCVIALVSTGSFIAEALILGYIPLFLMDTPHAYSYFHVSGLHYFTVSFVLLPAMAVLYLYERRVFGTAAKKELSQEELSGKELSNQEHLNQGLPKKDISKKELALLSICTSAGIILPVLLVSRYQLFFGLMLAGAVYLILQGGSISISFNRRTVTALVSAFFALLALYLFITVRRAHSIEYLNGIFEMKDPRTPIFITQPYMYIANNFDNLNCLVRDLPAHTHGLRMLFPWIALFGLKFTRPELAAFPIYVTKEELTTVTLVYDAYYDFGLAGVVPFVAAGAFLAAFFEQMALRYCGYSRHSGGSNATGAAALRFFFVMIYAQITIYLALAFFTTWLSNPTTWFLFGLTTLLSLCIWIMVRQR